MEDVLVKIEKIDQDDGESLSIRRGWPFLPLVCAGRLALGGLTHRRLQWTGRKSDRWGFPEEAEGLNVALFGGKDHPSDRSVTSAS